MISIEGKDILVIGLADSGYASSVTARNLGAVVTVIDKSTHPPREDSTGELKELGIDVRLGIDVTDKLAEYDLIITSPGVPDHARVIQDARKLNKRIISELEFGACLLDNKMIAVTGTNGKTTTTRLISWIMDSPERRAVPCGNIGKPIASLYGKINADDLLVVEVSSFQLRNIEDFRANVAVMLNIAPDHFDWHSDYGDYKSSKMRLIENMNEDDYLVYNDDDEFCREMAKVARGITVGFSLSGNGGKGLWLEDEWVVTGEPFTACRMFQLSEIRLRGVHNLANVCAAAGAALCLGESPARIREAVGGFKPIEHRMEFVAEKAHVQYFNDSKATNPHAAIHSIKSFEDPVVVILGGRNKGLEFTELAVEIRQRMDMELIMGVVVLGECAEELNKALEEAGIQDAEERIITAENMDEAVRVAHQLADGQASVLFSPACASFDMYNNYRDRGDAFKESVNSIMSSG